jgi:hypothetical protein
MKLPILTELATTRDMVDVFKGYNHNLRIGEGEFYDMKNLTSSNYPVLTPRKRRGLYAMTVNPQGLIQKDTLCYVDGRDFYINGYRVAMGLSTNPEDCPKALVSMGAYIIIMPDKMYINTADVTDFGKIEAIVTTKNTVTFEMCKVNGNRYGEEEQVEISSTAPEITEAMKNEEEEIPLWLDTSSTPHSLKQYSASMAMWTTIATTYIKISSAGIGKPFEVNDGVTISGIENKKLSDLNNTMIIWAKGDDYIVVTGVLDEVIAQEDPITVKRTMPNMDFVIESENRLWGCRYGIAANGEVVNEIYASKLGDFKNWNCFMGISTDSYAATVGTDGQFTGAVAHLGYPLFFKEHCMHKVYGNYPANYQISTTTCRGVQKGSHKSLAIVNEVLYYKSRTGVCAYDGSLPQEVSYALGDVAYSNAVACSHGNKYYISMHDDTGAAVSWIPFLVTGTMLFLQQTYGAFQDGNTLNIDGWEATTKSGETLYVKQAYNMARSSYRLYLDKDDGEEASKWHLFVYDTQKGMWHREDNTRVDHFCSCREDLYYIDHADQFLKTMYGSGTIDSRKVEWMAETGIIGTDQPDKKYISKLNIRMSLELGARVYVHIQYDSMEKWEFLFTMEGTNLQSFTVPIRPKRCDHLRLRVEGVGEAKIYSISKTIEQGSDV